MHALTKHLIGDVELNFNAGRASLEENLRRVWQFERHILEVDALNGKLRRLFALPSRSLLFVSHELILENMF